MKINKICDYSKCTGCGMCQQICNNNAILLHSDEEGFLHPQIDQNKCIGCGLCQKRCPINLPLTNLKNKPIKIYSGWSNNEMIRLASSSGGAFTEIAKIILAKGGVVFGSAMDKNVIARHIFINNEQDLQLLRGSKYVQSIIGNTYKETKQFLQEGRIVLFSGTPCQIAGLYNFLHKKYENLYTIDLICHGVPSPKVFNDYKIYIENIIKEPIKNLKFRCKKNSWIYFNIGINANGINNNTIKYSYTGSYYADPFIRAFLRDNILRPNCYQCQYCSLERLSDFTIADWWGYKGTSSIDKDFEKKGVSLIMCNTDKAVALSNHLDMTLRERTIEEARRTNPSLRHPFPAPTTRSKFWQDYRTKSFKEIVEKWMYPEILTLSKYIQVYYPKWKRVASIIHFYERCVRKIKLSQLIYTLIPKHYNLIFFIST